MHIQLRLDGQNPRRWHAALLDSIAKMPGCTASVNFTAGPEPLPANAAFLFRFEGLLHKGAQTHAAPAETADVARFTNHASAPDLVIDLCGDIAPGKYRLWQLQFGGAAGECALLGLLLAGHWPLVTLIENGHIIAAARPGSERGDVMSIAFNDVLGRTKHIILAALPANGALVDQPMAAAEITAPGLTTQNLGKAAGKQLAWKLIRALYRLCYNTPHWRTGWRKLDGPDLLDLRAHPTSGWTDLPDDARRFYADPFPVLHEGRLTLFVEDYPHATGKGIISAVEFGPNGPLGTPEPVLELPCHLSYPNVFERAGQMWMIPETSGAGTVELYRATKFPGGWVREAILLQGLVAGDVTLLEHGDKWWMFATVQEEGGSYSDTLHLWSAPDFRGPWQPHARNPVLIDMASARPAGRIIARNGAWLRPVQDCRAGYGAALGIARILQLDDEGYRQTVETVLTAGPHWSGKRLHTLNSAGGFEFIDGSGRARRF